MNDQAIESLEKMAIEEIKNEAPVVLSGIAAKFEEQFDVKDLVETRIKAFDLDRLEGIVMEIARKEFSTIEKYLSSSRLLSRLRSSGSSYTSNQSAQTGLPTTRISAPIIDHRGFLSARPHPSHARKSP